MTTPPATSPPPRSFTGYPAAFVLIVLFFALGLYASTFNSQTFDEGAHLAGGYIHLTLGHPRIHTENGYLSQAFAALPLLLTHPNPPATDSPAFQSADTFALGRDFLYHEGNSLRQLLLLGRAMIGLLTAITAFAVYTWSRKLFSPAAGILALLLFLAAPLVLAHGFLITSDMPATCFFTLSLAAFAWTLQKITPLRFVLTALALAALFLAKMSAPLLLPTLLLLTMLHILSLPRPRSSFSVLRSVFLLPLLGLAVYLLIWLAYGFTYSAFKNSPSTSLQSFYPSGQWTWALQNPNLLHRTIDFARLHHLLPESYLYGYAYVAQTTHIVVAYANGIISRAGWWWFYPYVFLITTPIPILLLFFFALLRPLLNSQTTPAASGSAGHRARSLILAFQKTAPLTIFILTYALVAILSYRGSGPRHLLPIYPMLCILTASFLTPMLRPAPFQNLSFRIYNFSRALVPLVLFWLALENLMIFPHYLSYTNELAGGPKNAYRHLVDSAVDWGQDLPALATFLNSPDAHALPAYLSYFGTAEPAAYGIHATLLPCFLTLPPNAPEPVPPLNPGLYCISVTMLENLYNNYGGNYNTTTEAAYKELRRVLPLRDAALKADTLSPKDRAYLQQVPSYFQDVRLARLCAYLQRKTPFAQAGYSINIYALTAEDLDAALNGPAPLSGNGQ